MRLGFESGETLPRWSYIFNRRIFDYYFLDHRHIFGVKRDYAVLCNFLSAIKLFFFLYMQCVYLTHYVISLNKLSAFGVPHFTTLRQEKLI